MTKMKKFIVYVKDADVTVRVGFMGADRKTVTEVARGYYPDSGLRIRQVTDKEWAKVKVRNRVLIPQPPLSDAELDEDFFSNCGI